MRRLPSSIVLCVFLILFISNVNSKQLRLNAKDASSTSTALTTSNLAMGPVKSAAASNYAKFNTAYASVSSLTSSISWLAPLQKEARKGWAMAQLSAFYPAADETSVETEIGHLIKASVSKTFKDHYSGVNLSKAATGFDFAFPRLYYDKVVALKSKGTITATQAAKLDKLIYRTFSLAAVRHAIARAALKRARSVHGVTTSLSIVVSSVLTPFRALILELASRLPRKLRFNEDRFWNQLMSLTGSLAFTSSNVPQYIDPVRAKASTLTFTQFTKVKRKWWWNESQLDACSRWATNIQTKSLARIALDAKTAMGSHYARFLSAQQVTEAELKAI